MGVVSNAGFGQIYPYAWQGTVSLDIYDLGQTHATQNIPQPGPNHAAVTASLCAFNHPPVQGNDGDNEKVRGKIEGATQAYEIFRTESGDRAGTEQQCDADPYTGMNLYSAFSRILIDWYDYLPGQPQSQRYWDTAQYRVTISQKYEWNPNGPENP